MTGDPYALISQVLTRVDALGEKFDEVVRASIAEVADLRVQLAEANRTVEITVLQRDQERLEARLTILEQREREDYAVTRQHTSWWDDAKAIIIPVIVAIISSGIAAFVVSRVK